MEKQIKPVEPDKDKGAEVPAHPADTARWPEDQEGIKYAETGEIPAHPGEERERLAEEAPAPKK